MIYLKQPLLNKLKNNLKKKFENKRVIVAYSGGIDSLLLSILLSEITETLCVFIKTPYISEWALNNAITNAEKYGLNLKVVEVNKIIKNVPERCYLCKKMFFDILNKEKEKYKYDFVVDGTNYDDLFEDRPGLKAKEEFNVISPFVDFKIGKKDILNIAKELNINIPPKETCLLTRFEFNREISIEDLKKIEELEEFLRNYVNGAIRVRDHKDIAVIEIESGFDEILRKKDKIVKKFKDYGFKKVCLNLEAY
ncbi:ATP-dependent sacrificial sulfur transferase LarE [Methanocaldococcus fervens]|uniref:Thiamine biosynthesis protein n=1 Tax=Methanocaldococcus fervens (strain DSM 4213 / JCM 15782 / AG86) TaxID=573064 RepID=C7P856_METFA|nr:ATP-dependent sacrificial sulfur transferase LarE [Methanocaldococcus fervens]ACV24738.1 thiamine biosynthesis protein [Methanocaldococcus fervens AG86]